MKARFPWSYFTRKCSTDSYLTAKEPGILASMNTQPSENQALPMSLREILARQGIESSYNRHLRKTKERLARMFIAETTTPIPGMEVTYLELDPKLWEQLAIATQQPA